jgi:glycosyltransferase involved in cell wall biosynthesis
MTAFDHAAADAPPTLSIVVPVYNETGRIEATLPVIADFVRRLPCDAELVVVDDGSADGTADLARRLLGSTPGRVLAEPHRGKGGAVRAGMLAARGRFRLFMDVDLATPLEFVEPCLRRLEDGADVVIGSRRIAAAEIERHQPPLREMLGRGYSWLSRTLSGVKVSDFTCGFKGFRAEAAEAVFSRVRIHNWSFDTELLFVASALRLRIDELPVRWRDDARTKVRLGRDIAGSLVGLVAMRVNRATGRYNLPR